MRFKISLLLFCVFLISCTKQIEFVSTFPVQKTSVLAGTNAPQRVDTGILFRYQTKKSVRQVYLAGTFNNWQADKLPMQKVAPGIFELVHPLAQGDYMYKYVENGQNWVTDPANPVVSEDGYHNSLMTIKRDGDVELNAQKYTKQNPATLWQDATACDSPTWIKNAIIYEVFVRAYSDNGFAGIINKFPHLKELGINTIWLMPTFEIGQAKRKGSLGSPYSVRDYYSVNHEFGNKEDFREFVEAAHANDFKVILGWVPNHTAWDNELINKHPDWYTKGADGLIIPPNKDWSDVADFDYNSPALRMWMTDALKYWLAEFDIDGYRFDVAALVPLDFWEELRPALHAVKADILLLAESEEKLHHTHGMDLTYASQMRDVFRNIARGKKTQHDFHQIYQHQKYSFPKNSLRMHWLENHDNKRYFRLVGPRAIYPVTSLLYLMDGVPLILMGQEWGDKKWVDASSLFENVKLDWQKFDRKLFNHYKY